MPWLKVDKKLSLTELARQQGVFPGEIWEHRRNKKFADASAECYDIFLTPGAQIYIPDDEERIVSQAAREERRRKKKPPLPPRTKTRSNISNVFKRPRSDADAEDRAKYILTAARPAFEEVHKIHNGKWYQKGLWHRIKGSSRYHSVKYTKRSTLDKAIMAAPGVAATGASVTITIVGLATAWNPAGWIMIPIGLSLLAVTLGLKAFYRHKDYTKRKVYYQKEMYCAAEGEAKGKADYVEQKSKAKGKWYRRLLVKLTPRKFESHVRVKDDIWQYKEHWREPLMADANQCIRPAVVHLRKARIILTEQLGGFFKAVDPNVEDHYGLIDLKNVEKKSRKSKGKEGKVVTKPTEEEVEALEEGKLEKPIEFDDYRELERCDQYIKHAKPAMRYLHELDKFRNYLLPSLNMCAFCLDEFVCMSDEWNTRQELVEDAINRFQKQNKHNKCGRFKFPKEIFYSGRMKELKSFIRFSNKHCYGKTKRPDLYLYHGQPGEATGSGKKTSGDKSSGKSGSPRPKSLDVVRLREMLTGYATAFQDRIKYDKLRVGGVQNPGTTPPGTQRAEKFLADIAKVYDKPGYLDQLSHRIKNYNMSTTKFEKFSCFAEHGFTITTKAINGGILPSIYKLGTKVAGVATNSVVKFSLKATEKIGKAIAGKVQKAVAKKQAKDSGKADDYYTFADGSNPYIIESDVLKTLKNELSLDTPIKRIVAMEYKAYEDEFEDIKRELDEKLDKGEIDEEAYQQGMAELNHIFYGVKKEKVKRQVHRSGKAAKKAAIGVERTFKQLDYHYREALKYVKAFHEIDAMAKKRRELKIELRSCSQCLRYVRWLYGYHHELEKMERYLMGSISVVAQLSEEAATYSEYAPAVWQVLDGAAGEWIREPSNHQHCLDGRVKLWKHCYGPSTKVGAAPEKVRRSL